MRSKRSFLILLRLSVTGFGYAGHKYLTNRFRDIASTHLKLQIFFPAQMRIPAYFWALSLTPLAALGNVEKVIFLAPPSISIPSSHSNLQDLYLDVLSTPLSLLSLRRQLPASFPSPTDPRGNETWLLLEGLEVGRRYEVRICWLATVRGLVMFLSSFCLTYAIATDIFSFRHIPIERSLRESESHFLSCSIFRKAPGLYL